MDPTPYHLPAQFTRHSRRSARACLALAIACALALLAHPTPAAAGEFTISSCLADAGRFSSDPFVPLAHPDMRAKRACNPEETGLHGLVTGNVVRAGRVPRGAISAFVLTAPDNTRFARAMWSWQARRRDCRYAFQIWADSPDGALFPIVNVHSNKRCPDPGHAQASLPPMTRTHDIPGATRIVQLAVCQGSKGEPYCSARGLNYIRTLRAEAVVTDLAPPSVGILQDNPFTRGEWVNGGQTVNYDANDNTGVKIVRAFVAGTEYGAHPRACDYGQRTPCVNGAGTIAIDTTKLQEGTQTLTLQALDAADNLDASAAAATVRVDNTAPGTVPVAVAGGEGWRNQNDFDLSWANPAEGDRAPIAAAHYEICRADGSKCTTGRRSAPGIAQLGDLAVPDSGEWRVRVWREDAATNREQANASLPVALRFDPDPPRLGFEELSASDPTRVSVLVDDAVSGLAGGQIELSRQGSSSWETLATQQEGSRLVARIDDARLPAGPYLLRATARDHAANQNSTDQLLDGRPMAINLPLRTQTAMSAGVMRERTVRTAVRRRGKRRVVRRRVARLVSRTRVALGRHVNIDGRLGSLDGQPIPGAEVQVLSRSATTPEQLLGVLHTDDQGRYAYLAQAGSTSILRFAYAGTPQILPSQSEVTLLVSATSTIRARPRRARNGQAVGFAGRLRSLPAPPAGKLVELQVLLSGHWQTFRTTRTGPEGAWRVRYRFRRSCGVLRYRFRARIPEEAGYPFETGRSRAVGVRVRGDPCP
jgi:hypothetical protein